MKKSLCFMGVVMFILLASSMMHAQDKYLVIPGCDFRPSDDLQQFYSTYGWAYLDSGSPGGYMIAPINLPQDATIISVTMSFNDTDAANDIDFYIARVNYYTYASQTLFSGSSSGSPGKSTVLDSTLNGGSRVIKNNSFYYTARFQPDTPAGSSLAVYCIKIKYQ